MVAVKPAMLVRAGWVPLVAVGEETTVSAAASALAPGPVVGRLRRKRADDARSWGRPSPRKAPLARHRRAISVVTGTSVVAVRLLGDGERLEADAKAPQTKNLQERPKFSVVLT
jgi:hypothetical protein